MELTYLKVRWLHDDPAYPVLLLSELDERRYEVRKVEIYAGGRIDIASAQEQVGHAEPGQVAVPPEEEIANDRAFSVEALGRAEFEQAWAEARARIFSQGIHSPMDRTTVKLDGHSAGVLV